MAEVRERDGAGEVDVKVKGTGSGVVEDSKRDLEKDASGVEGRDDGDGSYVFVDGGESDEVVVVVGDQGGSDGNDSREEEEENCVVVDNAGVEVEEREGGGESCKESVGEVVVPDVSSSETLDGEGRVGELGVKDANRGESCRVEGEEKVISMENVCDHYDGVVREENVELPAEHDREVVVQGSPMEISTANVEAGLKGFAGNVAADGDLHGEEVKHKVVSGDNVQDHGGDALEEENGKLCTERGGDNIIPASEVVDEKGIEEGGVACKTEVQPSVNLVVSNEEVDSNLSGVQLGDEAVSVENVHVIEAAPSVDSCCETPEGGKLEVQQISVVLGGTEETIQIQEKQCETENSAVGHYQVNGSNNDTVLLSGDLCETKEVEENQGHGDEEANGVEVVANVNNEEQSEIIDADVVQEFTNRESKEKMAAVVNESEERTTALMEGEPSIKTIEEVKGASELYDDQELNVSRNDDLEEVQRSSKAAEDRDENQSQTHDLEHLNEKQTDTDGQAGSELDQVTVKVEDSKDDGATNEAEVAKTSAPENEEKIPDADGVSPEQGVSKDLHLNQEFSSQKELEDEKSASDRQSEANSTCIANDVEVVAESSNIPSENSDSLSNGVVNGPGHGNQPADSVQGVELATEVSSSQLHHGVCKEPTMSVNSNNLSSCPLTDIVSENNQIESVVDCNQPVKKNLSDEKELKCEPGSEILGVETCKTCDAVDTDVGRVVENDSREDHAPVSVEEAERKFLTTQALIVQWEGDSVSDTVEPGAVEGATISSCSPETRYQPETVENKEINETSLENTKEVSNKNDSWGDQADEKEIVPSSTKEASNIASQEQTAELDSKHLPCYIVRVPKFFDDNLMAQKEVLELQVDEKTRSRDSIKSILQSKKATTDDSLRKLDAARKEEKAARNLFNAKRSEIEAIQVSISKMKNATSVDEIEDKIRNLEHRIQHETIPLREEKQLIREIKSLKQSREQFLSSLGSQAEVQHAFDQKDKIDEQFERLKQELNSLRGEMIRAETNAKAIKKKYDDEWQSIRDLNAQRDAANNLRQETYSSLWNIKKEYFEKNVHFYHYKDDRRTAENLASSGDKDALRLHCSNQVEKVMELWNTNEEFRKQYIKFNMVSTVRRFKTLDGRSLGPDEEPVLPPIRSVKQRGVRLPSPKIDMVVPSKTDEEEPKKPVTPEKADKQPASKAAQGNHVERPKKQSKTIPEDSAAVTASAEVLAEDNGVDKEKEKKRIEEEEHIKKANELARQEEKLRKEKAAAEERERNRLEQIAKAKEAEERKRRKAEKAKAKAEYKAQKDAELKEKKKAMKESRKQKLADSTDTANDGSEVQSLPETNTSIPETVQETEIKKTATKRSSRSIAAPKQNNKLKPLPLPLRNKVKRKMQTWMWVLLSAAVVLLLFLGGNYISFGKFSPPNTGF